MIKKETILEKIQKLLSKAESLKQLGSLKEAESFIGKANTLLLEYNLSLSDINFDKEDKDYEISETDKANAFKFGLDKNFGKWDEELLKVIAKANFCDTIIRTSRTLNKTKNGYSYEDSRTLVGTKTNIEVVTYIYNFVKGIMPSIANESYNKEILKVREIYRVKVAGAKLAAWELTKGYPELGRVQESDLMPSDYSEAMKTQEQFWILKNVKLAGLQDRGVFVRSFLIGAVAGLKIKFAQEIKEYDEVHALTSTSLTIQSIIKVNNDKLEKYFKKQGYGSTIRQNAKASDVNAFGMGQVIGKNLSINKGINQSVNNTIQKQLI